MWSGLALSKHQKSVTQQQPCGVGARIFSTLPQAPRRQKTASLASQHPCGHLLLGGVASRGLWHKRSWVHLACLYWGRVKTRCLGGETRCLGRLARRHPWTSSAVLLQLRCGGSCAVPLRPWSSGKPSARPGVHCGGRTRVAPWTTCVAGGLGSGGQLGANLHFASDATAGPR